MSHPLFSVWLYQCVSTSLREQTVANKSQLKKKIIIFCVNYGHTVGDMYDAQRLTPYCLNVSKNHGDFWAENGESRGKV